MMPLTREQLENEAQSLPREERARLAETLIASLDEDAEIERAWMDEAERRAAELDSGAVESVPAEDVFSELDSLVKERVRVIQFHPEARREPRSAAEFYRDESPGLGRAFVAEVRAASARIA